MALATEEAQVQYYNPIVVTCDQILGAIDDTRFEAEHISSGEEDLSNIDLLVEGAFTVTLYYTD